MTSAHKDALAQGRSESRAVRAYLEALEAHRPKRGRKRTVDSIERRLQGIELELEDTDPLTRVRLTQERMNLQEELAVMESGNDLGELEAQFLEVAASYSDRQGISYAAWREIGVAPAVLRAAGVSR
jgi:hypothetical protein